jgi:hypothetical protein
MINQFPITNIINVIAMPAITTQRISIPRRRKRNAPDARIPENHDHGTASASLMVTLSNRPTKENKILRKIFWYKCELRRWS